jgi:hypothetical protein
LRQAASASALTSINKKPRHARGFSSERRQLLKEPSISSNTAKRRLIGFRRDRREAVFLFVSIMLQRMSPDLARTGPPVQFRSGCLKNVARL